MKIKQYKIARRLGVRIFPKTENPKLVLTRKPQGTKRRGRPLSEFGSQLLEKQKARLMYGLREKQFSRYVKEAIAKKAANPAEELYRKLECRLDNVLYRLGFTKTRRHARQMVSHGHIVVNGRKVAIPSYVVSVDDVVGIRPGSADKTLFSGLDERFSEYNAPAWLLLDKKKKEGTVTALPAIDTDVGQFINLTSILEFYSR